MPDSTTSSPLQPSAPSRREVWPLLLLLLGIFALPSAFHRPGGFGLDPSWHMLINKVFSEGRVFGTQVVWTYGPFGFLEWRLPYGVSLCYYLAFDLLLLALAFRVGIDAVKSNPDRVTLAACIASLPALKALINDAAPAALFCFGLCFLLRMLRAPDILTSVALAVVATIMFFFKLNLGIALVGLCGLGFCFKIAARDGNAARWLFLAGGIMVCMAAASWLLPVNLPAYVRFGLVLVKGYSDSMSVGPESGTYYHGLIWLFFLLSLVLPLMAMAKAVFRPDRWRAILELAPAWIAGSAGAFVLFKSAIVRSDYAFHNKTFLFGFPLVALAFMLYAPDALRKVWKPLFLASAFGSLVLLIHEPRVSLMARGAWKDFLPVNYLQGAFTYQQVTDWKSYLSRMQATEADRRVPDRVREIIGTNTVDVFPHEASLPIASGLNYQPRPVLQSYAVVDPVTEGLNLAYYQSPAAPRFILYGLGPEAASPDHRYTLWDEPTLKRWIRRNYHLRHEFQVRQPEYPTHAPVLLLERNAVSTPLARVEVKTEREMLGREFSLPESDGELYAEIKLRKSLSGRLASFFYRGAPVRVRFSLADGKTSSARIVPANLERGVLVNFFAEDGNAAALGNYFREQSNQNPKCLKLRLECEHAWEFEPEFEVTYFKLR